MKKREEKSRLSPWPYIRNNRVRSTVLVISLAVFVVLIYMMNYIIGGVEEPYWLANVEPYDRIQYAAAAIDITPEDYATVEEYRLGAWQAVSEQCDAIRGEAGIIDAKVCSMQRVVFQATVGTNYQECLLFEGKSDCEEYLQHMDGRLSSGRMPEAAGEILVDQRLVDNNKHSGLLLSLIGTRYHVVGVVDSPYYLACGIAHPGENNIRILLLTESAQVDARPIFEKHGFRLKLYTDRASAEVNHRASIGDLDTVQTLFTVVSAALLMICVVVVLALHIMDRHNEWCLLNSIGFTSGEIYLMALKEMLICMGIALAVGAVLCFGVSMLIKFLLFQPRGLYVKIWRPQVIPRILAVFVALLGIIQIPLFSGMRKIQTIDEIEN